MPWSVQQSLNGGEGTVKKRSDQQVYSPHKCLGVDALLFKINNNAVGAII